MIIVGYIEKWGGSMIFLICLLMSMGLMQAQDANAQDSETPGTGGYHLLVKCSGSSLSGSGVVGASGGANECTFKDFIAQVNKIIDFLFYFSVLLAIIAFVWAGFLFLTAGGDTGKAGEAKSVFFKVVVGFIWIFAAWLIVHFLTKAFDLNPGYTLLEK